MFTVRSFEGLATEWASALASVVPEACALVREVGTPSGPSVVDRGELWVTKAGHSDTMTALTTGSDTALPMGVVGLLLDPPRPVPFGLLSPSDL